VRFAFIAVEKATYPVRVLCRTLAVSRAGFYAWHTRPPARRTQQDQRLGVEIQAIHAETRRRYGSPRVHAELRERGQRVGCKRVARLMRAHGLCARRRRRFRITTDSNHPLAVAPNVLARHFTVPAPDTAWVTDITYLWTQEGWLYLAVILDLFSRAVVGWALSARITRHLTLQALTMALGRRRPPAGTASSLGSGQPVRQRRLSAGPPGPWDRLQHEPPRQLLGQRRGREFLRDGEGRAGARRGLGHARAGAG